MFSTSLLNPQVSTGTIIIGGATAPAGYLLCDGSAISRTLYASLFAVIGTQYGAGNGSTTFNLPDLNEPIPLGTTAPVSGNIQITGNGNPMQMIGHINGSYQDLGYMYLDGHSSGGSGDHNVSLQNPNGFGGGPGVYYGSGLQAVLQNATVNLAQATAATTIKFYIKY